MKQIVESATLSSHLRALNDEDDFLKIINKDDSYISFNVTQNYTLRPLEVELENLYDYKDKYCISRSISKNVARSSDSMTLHPDHPFHDKKL